MATAIELDVQARCTHCRGHVILLRGLRDIIDTNPRSLWPGVFLLAVFLAAGATARLLELAFDYTLGSVSYPDLTSKIIGFVVLAPILVRLFPLRMLICAECRRGIKTGIGRVVPEDWHYYIEPSEICLSCGYSLLGIRREARCPECGHPFPSSWLNVTCRAPDGKCGNMADDEPEPQTS